MTLARRGAAGKAWTPVEEAPVRILMISWEYPPMRVGGIAAALEGLAPALARAGVEVHVITCGDAGGPPEETPAPHLHIHRVSVQGHANDFIHWVHLLNEQIAARAEALLQDFARAERRRKKRIPTVLHVHDWLGLFAARVLKYSFRLPMVATIHATEFGRNSGVWTDTQRYINQCEYDLQYEAWRVIVCSAFMRGEVEFALGTPWDKMDVVYNGVTLGTFDFPFPEAERAAFRGRFAAPWEKIVYFIGRMVHEKGAQVLIDALPRVRAQYHDAKLVIAGGGNRGHLEDQAWRLGVAGQVYFTGRVSDEDRDRLYRIADVAVYPSLYEPFGIVALEAMAARAPVVVSNAGGLAEVVEHGHTGTTTYAGNPDSLAWGIVRVLTHPEHARWMADNAYERCRTVFSWDRIAHQTREIYERVWAEYLHSSFKP